MVKNLLANAGDVRDVDLIPGSGRSPGEGHDNPLQYSCPENPHGQRSLAGYSLWGLKESDTAEHTYTPIMRILFPSNFLSVFLITSRRENLNLICH